jgi:hypothetical protein
VLYRVAHEQVRTAWAFLPEFHQIFNGLHLVGGSPQSNREAAVRHCRSLHDGAA